MGVVLLCWCVAELRHEDRIHDSLDKDTLDRRPVEPKPAPSATIISLPPAWPPRATVRAGFSRRIELKEELRNRKRCQGVPVIAMAILFNVEPPWETDGSTGRFR